MQELIKIFRDLIAPVALLICVFIIKPYAADNVAIQTSYLQYLPLILLGIAIILSWKFNRQQCFYLLSMIFLYSAIFMLLNSDIKQFEQTQTNFLIAAFAFFKLFRPKVDADVSNKIIINSVCFLIGFKKCSLRPPLSSDASDVNQ